MITLKNVSKQYNNGKAVHALRNINLTLERGERVAIMGPSGSGKSTLLNIICGLDEPTEGSVRIENVDLSQLNDDERTELRRNKIGMVFQTFNLLPTLSTIENVALPLRLQGIAKGEAERRALNMLQLVGLKDRSRHRPDALSGGERQRVAIARALIFYPPVLLADEPTGNVDSKTGDEILDLLTSLHRDFNTTILIVTHNPRVAARCDRVIALHDGQVVDELNTKPDKTGV